MEEDWTSNPTPETKDSESVKKRKTLSIPSPDPEEKVPTQFFKPKGLLEKFRKKLPTSDVPSVDINKKKEEVYSHNFSSTYFTTSSTTTDLVSLQANQKLNVVTHVESNPTIHSSTHVIAHLNQKANPLIKSIKNVGVTFSDKITADYVLGKSCAALFLRYLVIQPLNKRSLRYHLLHPTYIQQRIESLKDVYAVRIFLCLVDIEDTQKVLQQLSILALQTGFTLILAWSTFEAARYLETFKVYENKGPELLKERPKEDHLGKVTDLLTSLRSVNRTDVLNLAQNFGNMKNIIGASMEDLSLCPGLGEKKIRSMYNAFHQPFLLHSKQSKLHSFVEKEEEQFLIYKSIKL